MQNCPGEEMEPNSAQSVVMPMRFKQYHRFRLVSAILIDPLLTARAGSTSAPHNDLTMTSVKMLFGRHAHWSLKKQLHPVVRVVTMRPAPSQVMPYL